MIACTCDTALSAIALALPDPVAHVMLPCRADELSNSAERVKRLALPSTTAQHLSS